MFVINVLFLFFFKSYLKIYKNNINKNQYSILALYISNVDNLANQLHIFQI